MPSPRLGLLDPSDHRPRIPFRLLPRLRPASLRPFSKPTCRPPPFLPVLVWCVQDLASFLPLRRPRSRRPRGRIAASTDLASSVPPPFGVETRAQVAVIPARYGSTRFPGKPLVHLCGKPMIQWTYERVRRAETVDEVVVATDDERIVQCCVGFGAKVVRTSPDCPNGTTRCEEAVHQLRESYDVVVNVQGDEPLIEPRVVDQVVRCLLDAKDAVYSTACTPMRIEGGDVDRTHRVKIVLDRSGYVLYSSRGTIPHNKEGNVRPFPEPFGDACYLLHVGIHCFDRAFLKAYCQLEPTPCMAMEDLEHLKVLEHGYRMKCALVDGIAHGVDVPEDVPLVEEVLYGSLMQRAKMYTFPYTADHHSMEGKMTSSCS